MQTRLSPKSTLFNSVSLQTTNTPQPSSYQTAFNNPPQSRSWASVPGICRWGRDLLESRPIEFTAHKELSSKKVTKAIPAHLLLQATPPLPHPSLHLENRRHLTQPILKGLSLKVSPQQAQNYTVNTPTWEAFGEILNPTHCNPITTIFLSDYQIPQNPKGTNFLSSSLSRTRSPKKSELDPQASAHSGGWRRHGGDICRAMSRAFPSLCHQKP